MAEESGSVITATIWGVFSVTQMRLDVFSPFALPQVIFRSELWG